MTSSAIVPHPIEPIAARPIDAKLEAAFLNSLSDYGARLHGRRIWLACSGGRDSLALAALCVQLYRVESVHQNSRLQQTFRGFEWSYRRGVFKENRTKLLGS